MIRKLLRENDISLQEKIINFLTTIEIKSDEDVHNFADSIGIDPHIIKLEIYKFIQAFTRGGDFNKSGISEDIIDKNELQVGQRVEYEHTLDQFGYYSQYIAKRIALDHLAESIDKPDPKYYKNLMDMENQMGKSK